jgi:hypothetical protein
MYFEIFPKIDERFLAFSLLAANNSGCATSADQV